MYYRVKNLKGALKSRGININGKKQYLCCRLVKSIEENVELMSSDAQKNSAGASFSPGENWNLLQHDGSFVD